MLKIVFLSLKMIFVLANSVDPMNLTIPSLLYQTRRKNPLVFEHKGLKENSE